MVDEKKQKFDFKVREPEQKPQQPSKLDGDIAIHFNLRKLLKTSLIVLLLLGVFVAGRWSVDVSTFDFSSSSSNDREVETVKNEVVLAPKETVNTTVPTTITGASVGNEPKPVENLSVKNAEEGPQGSLVTDYRKVALSLNDVTVDWHDTWGKITQLKYTIKNNEEGYIKPDHFIMLVEGYDDLDKKISLSLTPKYINPGETKTGVVTVPGGFSYSRVSAGELTAVRITITMHDMSDKVMAPFMGEFNLQR